MTPTSESTPRRWPATLGAALTGVLCLGAGGTPALVAGDVVLDWRGPSGCPGETAFRERTADLFDFKDPFVPEGTRASSTLRIEIGREAKGYRATLTHLDADGSARASSVERHDNCDALVYALAHRARLALGRRAVAAAPSPPAAPPAPALDPRSEQEIWRRLDRLEEADEARQQEIEALKRQHRAQQALIEKLKRDLEDEKKKMNLTYTLSTGALITANLTSNVGPGVWVAGDLRYGPLVMGLDLRAVLPSRVVVGPHDLDLSQIVGLMTPCGRYSVFFGCAVAGAGVQIDHDSDFDDLAPGQSQTGFVPLVQLGGRAGVEVPLGDNPFAIRGWGEVLYSTPAVRFSYSDGAFTRRPDVSAFFGLGFVVKFGKEREGTN